MAYKGYLVKLIKDDAQYDIPMSLITESSYKGAYVTNDVGAYRDSFGDLHRDVAPHRKFKVQFTTPPINSKVWEAFHDKLAQFYTDSEDALAGTGAIEKRAYVSVYIDELATYVQGFVYIPDIDFVINHIDNAENIIYYNPIDIKFIEY